MKRINRKKVYFFQDQESGWKKIQMTGMFFQMGPRACLKTRRMFILLCFILQLTLFFSVIAYAENSDSYGDSKEYENIITIETSRKYQGMKQSFSKGYEPSIKKNTMYLVVPFVTKAKLDSNRIIVGISFEREENSPFYYKNYQKKVKQSEDGVYLYQCQIKLKEDRINGQYPLHLSVQAQTEEKMFRQDFIIYAEITDGRVPSEEEPEQPDGSDKAGMGEELVQPDPGEDVIPAEQGSEPKEEINHQPRVMISANSLQGTAVTAGTSQPWSVSVKNCSTGQSLENMKITLISENKDIVLEKNSWYFPRLGAGTAVDLSQNLSVGKKAAAEPASLQFQFEYEDKKGNAYTCAETVNLSVSQIPQAELVNVSFPESIYEADTDFLTFQIQNTGLAVLYNVKARFEGKGLFPEKELFLGTMEAGTSLDGEIKVFAGTLNMDSEGNIIEEDGKKYGETTGTVVFSYENEQGELTEQSQEVHTSIKKPQVVELKVEKEAPKTNQWWITIIILILIVLILIICWLYLRMNYYKLRANK